jgi:acyl carrier protein
MGYNHKLTEAEREILMEHSSGYIVGALCGILAEMRITGNDTEIINLRLLGPGGIMDSLTATQFIGCVEQKFGIDIIGGDLNLDCMENVTALAEYIYRNIP